MRRQGPLWRAPLRAALPSLFSDLAIPTGRATFARRTPRLLPPTTSFNAVTVRRLYVGIGTVPYTGTAVLLRVKYGADRTVTVPYARLPRPVRVRYGYGTAVYGYGRRYGTSIVMEPRGWVQSVGEACTNFLEGAGADLEQEVGSHLRVTPIVVSSLPRAHVPRARYLDGREWMQATSWKLGGEKTRSDVDDSLRPTTMFERLTTGCSRTGGNNERIAGSSRKFTLFLLRHQQFAIPSSRTLTTPLRRPSIFMLSRLENGGQDGRERTREDAGAGLQRATSNVSATTSGASATVSFAQGFVTVRTLASMHLATTLEHFNGLLSVALCPLPNPSVSSVSRTSKDHDIVKSASTGCLADGFKRSTLSSARTMLTYGRLGLQQWDVSHDENWFGLGLWLTLQRTELQDRGLTLLRVKHSLPPFVCQLPRLPLVLLQPNNFQLSRTVSAYARDFGNHSRTFISIPRRAMITFEHLTMDGPRSGFGTLESSSVNVHLAADTGHRKPSRTGACWGWKCRDRVNGLPAKAPPTDTTISLSLLPSMSLFNGNCSTALALISRPLPISASDSRRHPSSKQCCLAKLDGSPYSKDRISRRTPRQAVERLTSIPRPQRQEHEHLHSSSQLS
ncbi:hypothetical protein C8F01DRAFT_1083752 [Mycena amicta]|nr:hypothetical protein C8F01DRAFT_1083752 [Mycena amicta]